MNLQNWLHGNKLSLNVVKTQSLIIGSRPNIKKIEKQTEALASFEIGDQKINMIIDTEYLGVQIAILNMLRLRHCELSVLLSLPRNFFHQVICRKCTEEFFSHISVIAARFGVIVVKPNLILSKRSRIELQE